MSKFKVGDLVRRINHDHRTFKKGDEGVITYVDPENGGLSFNGGDYTYSAYNFVLAYSVHPNDTVRLKSGEPFTTGRYTADVDSVRDDIVLLKHGSWLPVDAVEKVDGWLPGGAGWIEYRGGGNPAPGATVQWLLDHERRDREFTAITSLSNDLSWGADFVAYRVVEPAPAPAAEPAAETDFDPAAQPKASTLSIDGVSVEGTPQVIADLATSAIGANGDFVTVSISGHPVAVADFLAVLR